MANDTKHIHSYCSPNDLYDKIIEGLKKLGEQDRVEFPAPSALELPFDDDTFDGVIETVAAKPNVKAASSRPR